MKSNGQKLAIFELPVLAVVGAYFLLRPGERDAELDVAQEALITHSPEKLYPYVTLDEQAEGLTREKWILVYQRLIEPRFRRVKIVGPPERSTNATTTAGFSYPVRLANGTDYGIGFILDFGNQGPRSNLMMLLTQAWTLEFLEKNPKRINDPKRRFEAFYAGLRQDLPVLNEIGIKTFVSSDPLKPKLTWEELLATEPR